MNCSSILKISFIENELREKLITPNLFEIFKYINQYSELVEFRNKINIQEFNNENLNNMFLTFTDNYPEGTEIDLLTYFKKIENDLTPFIMHIKTPEIPCLNVTTHKFNTFMGREKELVLLEIFLKREYKNNVVVVGNPGVGKTTLIQELCEKEQFKVQEINVGSILSGTKYRGEFEEKFLKVVNQAISDKKILFIDEIHLLLDAGNSEGGISAANILKPYLTRNDFQMIGATTTKEYEIFLNDSAFERRFNFLMLSELPQEVLYNIFEEKYFGEVTKKNFEEIKNWLDSILPNRYYPDKLLDFLDFYSASFEVLNRKDLKYSMELFESAVNIGRD